MMLKSEYDHSVSLVIMPSDHTNLKHRKDDQRKDADLSPKIQPIKLSPRQDDSIAIISDTNTKMSRSRSVAQIKKE